LYFHSDIFKILPAIASGDCSTVGGADASLGSLTAGVDDPSGGGGRSSQVVSTVILK